MGILRRAFERGKALPKKLERALKIQAGLALPDGQITDIDAYHINQRDEGIDLQGVSGALMATSNMQMQTFVTQASENTEGFDAYNGDLTGDVAATLGVNCGMSTGRNGVIAFAANQRDEVRDLHDVAGALNAQPGIKQQTFAHNFMDTFEIRNYIGGNLIIQAVIIHGEINNRIFGNSQLSSCRNSCLRIPCPLS